MFGIRTIGSSSSSQMVVIASILEECTQASLVGDGLTARPNELQIT